jgi:hypothetical protein
MWCDRVVISMVVETRTPKTRCVPPLPNVEELILKLNIDLGISDRKALIQFPGPGKEMLTFTQSALILRYDRSRTLFLI